MTLPVSWHGSWSGKKALVLGLGKSGFSACDTLVELGLEVAAVGGSAAKELIDLVGVIGAKFFASEEASVLDQIGFEPDMVIVSPGFSPEHPLVQEVQKRGWELLTDIDLAWRLRDKTQKTAKWISITGTNGKTTTCEMVQAMINRSGQTAISCGNIGTPILDAIRDPNGFDYFVIELSSFQLHYLGVIEPVVSAFLNIAEDHLDWHGDFDQYLDAKSKVYQNTTEVIVFNEQDPNTLVAAEQADVAEGARAVSFSLGSPAVSMVGYVDDFLVDRAFLDDRKNTALEIASFDDISNISRISKQLLANCAAATTIARAVGIEPAVIREAIREFVIAPHRIQYCGEFGGVEFINDSKATNAHAADSSLSSFDSIVWILGGLLKGVDPEPVILKHASKIRAAVLIGKDSTVLEELFAKHLPDLELAIADQDRAMASAVELAAGFANPGDTVLLAPLAASMDQFVDYADRGNQFVEAVRGLGAK